MTAFFTLSLNFRQRIDHGDAIAEVAIINQRPFDKGRQSIVFEELCGYRKEGYVSGHL